MPKLTSNKAAFVRHADPDIFISMESNKRKWMRHSVAVLVLSPRVDQLALVLPKKAAERGAEHVRVPPQLALQGGSVKTTAATIARQLLVRPPKFDDLDYLGTGRGNAHRGQVLVQYGKYIHWFGMRLHSTKAVFRDDSDLFDFAHWCSANHLLAMDAFAMSDRKYMLTLQAITAFNVLGADGTLIRRAQQYLAA